jgi:uncharacterized protein
MPEIKRLLEGPLREDAKSFRVVTVLGPRQAGKTTLTKMAFPKYRYVSLEELDNRELASTDPKTFLRRFPSPAIYDEIQRVPDLLSYIQSIVDDAPDQKGQFILTGSHQPILREKVAQTLAGRTSILTLYPLCIAEIRAHGKKWESNIASEWIYRGFMPEIYRSALNPTRMYQAYTQTYVERDVRQLIQIKEQILFERFLKLTAGRIGQLLNFDSLANDVGVSPKTITEWISVLEASFIIFRLPPYFKNMGKRLVKTPKIYFTDVGLAAYLLGLESPAQVERDPLYGNIFENLVVLELVKSRLNAARNPDLFFYRDSHGKEVDIIRQMEGKLFPIEVKSSATFNSSLIKDLNYFLSSIELAADDGLLIFSGESGPVSQKIQALHFSDCYSSVS